MNREDSLSPRSSPAAVVKGRRSSASQQCEEQQQQQQQRQQQRKLKLAISADNDSISNSNSSSSNRPLQGLTTPRQQQQQQHQQHTECRSPLTARSARASGGDDCVSVAAHALSMLEGASATEAMLLAAQVKIAVLMLYYTVAAVHELIVTL